MQVVLDMLREMETSRFYGSVEIKFESGRPVLIKRSETIKPTESNYGDTRRNHEQPRR